MKLLQKMAFMSAGALSLMNLTAVMPAVLSVSAEEKGTWSFDKATGTLTISGEWPDFYNDYDHLKSKLDELEKAAQAMAEAMYQQQANGQQAYGNAGGFDQNAYNNNNSAPNNDDVVDADFKTK